MPAPRVVEYDSAWPAIAEDWQARILVAVRQLPGSADFVGDHIGSTAVPGLAAKPIIDLQLRVPTLPVESDLVAALERLGLRLAAGSRPDSPGVRSDIPRLGTDPDPALHAKLLFHRPAQAGKPEVILHVRRRDSPFADFVLRFRDWLRADADNAGAYAALKHDLASRYADADDYDDYTRAKSGFLDAAQIAMGWPASTRP